MKKIILIITLLFNTINASYAQTIKPYNEVITLEAHTKKGVLTTHLLANKLYFEIPATMLNKEMLFVKHNPVQEDDYKQVKWLKNDHKMHLIITEVASQVGNTIPLIENKYDATLTAATFPVLAMGSKSSSYVIDVTSLFLNPPKALPGNGDAIVNDLAAINKVITIDNTVEVKTTKTITSKDGPLTVAVDFSVLLLPKPMMPRLFDHRMGFASDVFKVMKERELQRAAIKRWRLEKKHPEKPLSEPVNPITLYFDPATPAKLKPYIKAGVEAWLPAFEAAGFKNAVVVKEPPIHDENWSINSIRYSYIRWIDRTHYRGKEGSGIAGVRHIIDRRTGEILKGDVLVGGLQNNLSNAYFVRCSPLDSRAQKFPFPDDLIGELYQALTAHEVGHVFGLKDGNYGEYTYPFKKMCDKEWLKDMGHTPSIMNYARQNFIVQPEDQIPPNLLHQKVGPTDLYSIRWGYTLFKDAKTPDAELPYLEKIIKEQDTTPWYIYLDSGNADQPQDTNEVVESDNPIKATALGIKNLKRVIQLIPSATQNESDDKLKKMLYRTTLWLWVDQMRSVAALVGGQTRYYKSRELIYTPIPAQRQKEAVAFLLKEAFNPPLWMHPENLMNYGENQVSKAQLKILEGLLRGRHLEFMEQNIKNGYSTIDLLEDLNAGLWTELNAGNIKINSYRQEIQIAYITMLTHAIEFENPGSGGGNYSRNNKYLFNNRTRGIVFSALQSLKKSIEEALKNTKDIATKGHLELCLLELNTVQN